MPDPKVIGKISSTLEEIRDILTGKQSSKLYNNIQSIAATSISMSEMMKELVDMEKEKNKVSLKSAILGKKTTADFQKITSKSVASIATILGDIRDNVKGIAKKSDINLSGKGGAKDEKKMIDNIIKDSEKGGQNQKLLGMITVVTKLKEISLKDIFTSKFKIKSITNIYDNLQKSFKKFKNKNEVKKVNEFAIGATEVVKKLSKIAVFGKLGTMGVKTIDAVFFGKFGLIPMLSKMKKHEKDLRKAKKITNDLFIISGKLFLVTLMMTGVALLGIGAMAGVLMTAAMMVVFGVAFSIVGLMQKPIQKGITVMNGMMISLVLAGIGLFLLNKATKDMEWKQLGMAAAAIVGFGLIAALLGIPYVFGLVSLGCIAMSLMGVALIAIGAGVALFGKMVTDEAISKVANGIPRIFDAMTSIFGDEEPGEASFGSTIMGLITGCLRLGGAVFAAGALIIIGIALGVLGLCIQSWNNVQTKAIDNIEYALGKLSDIFGLDLANKDSSVAGAALDYFTAPLQMASALVSFGKSLLKLGTLLFAGIILGMIKEDIDKWNKFNPKSIDNIIDAVTKLDDFFDLGFKEQKKRKGFFGAVGGFLKDTFNVATGPLQMGSALINSGKTFQKLGTLSMAVGVCDKLVEVMIKAGENAKTMENSMDSVFEAFDKMIDFFFNDKRTQTNAFDVISKMGPAMIGGLLLGPIGAIGGFMLGSDDKKSKITLLSMSVGVVEKMVDALIKMKDYSGDLNSAIDSTFKALNLLIDMLFGSADGKSKGACQRIGEMMERNQAKNAGIGTLIGGVLLGPAGALLGAGIGMMTSGAGDIKTQIELLTSSVGIVAAMADALMKMNELSPNINSAIDSVFYALGKLIDCLFGSADGKQAGALSKIGKAMMKGKLENAAAGAMIGGAICGPVGALIGGGIGMLTSGSGDIETQIEILTSCVGIVATMADALMKLNELSGSIDSSIDSLYTAFDRMISMLFGSADGKQAGVLSKIGKEMMKGKLENAAVGAAIGGYLGGPVGALIGGGIGMLTSGSGDMETQLEILTTCVGIVATMAEALSTMDNLTGGIEGSINNVFKALNLMTDYFFGSADKEQAGALSRVGKAMALSKAENFLFGAGDVDSRLELLTSCVGIIGQVAEAIKTMSDTNNVETAIDAITGSFDKIINFIFNHTEDELDNAEDIADELPGVMEELQQAVDPFKEIDEASLKNLKKFAECGPETIKNIVHSLDFGTDDDEDYLDEIEDAVDELPAIFKHLAKCLDRINGDYENAFNNLSNLSKAFSDFDMRNVMALNSLGRSVRGVVSPLSDYCYYTDEDRMEQFNRLVKNLTSLGNTGNAFSSIGTMIDKINTIDIEKASALKDTFKSFTSINSFGGFFFNFKKQVALFTDACVRLVDAINGNTDALTSENIMSEGENATPEPSKKSIAISNVEALAQKIADAIDANSFGGGMGGSTTIDLRINGDGGDSWVIRKY